MDLSGTLATVVAQIKAAGVETCSTDPADILAPGVLVQLVDFQPVTMTGWEVNLNLVLVASDTDGGPGPAAALSTLLNTILAWARPDGPIQARSVQLPSGPAPLPGLVFPLTVRTDA
jgi:hypothetical protein